MIDLVRRDPSSPAFIDLGEAYLNLGRPRDAAQVGNLGLEASPDNLEGRVMLARAYAQLHQWKEAQGELLRVVKVDRSNRTGFALLGEVLLRRSDFERAVPVLQHAQNLDPTSPSILSMLKRARAGQTLDAPAPVPQPVPPRGETQMGQQPAPPAVPNNAMMATQVPRSRPMPPSAPPPMSRPPVPMSSPQMPTMAINPANPPPMANEQSFVPTGAPDAKTYSPTAAPPPRAPKQTAPPPMSLEGVRPRMLSGAKPQNAAAASLRQSAAVGENYLNDLLTGGLLDVAGVRVPDGGFDLRPDRRWGRSTRRSFIFLFVVLVLGIGGGGGWYWWSEKKTGEAITRLQKDAKLAFALGDYARDGLDGKLEFGFRAAAAKLQSALDKDAKNLMTFAHVIEAGGLEALLYGTSSEGVDAALKSIGTEIPADAPGGREVIIGKAALELSRLQTLSPGVAKQTLADITKLLDAHLAKHEDDRWARWLKGRAQLAAGERKDARATIKRAADGDDGLLVAMIDEADLLVDDGKLETALPIYKKVLAKSKDHPLAVLGIALGRAEAAIDTSQALNDLNDKFIDGKTPPRVTAYRSLARVFGNLDTEEYEKASAELKIAVAVANPKPGDAPPRLGDPRFWARVAWIHYSQGRLKDVEPTVKIGVRWYGSKKAEDDPLAQLLDAGLAIASGTPDKALDIATKIDGIRPKLLRAQAHIDLGQYAEALKESEEVIKLAEENLDARVLQQQAKLMSNPKDKEKEAAVSELVSLTRKLKKKIASNALGVAYLALGDATNAKEAFTKALVDVTDETPNPVA
ncbi:MAG: tetratricopeptide repeat protein, partial [Deltaproteobacteria bacterium]|nr:tetratricopeptide repeat protein [Deltaproteobacteria bacterium]